MAHYETDFPARTHVPHMEPNCYNSMPKTGWRELKLFRYDGTHLYQWFGKRGRDATASNFSVFEDACDGPFEVRPYMAGKPEAPATAAFERQSASGWVAMNPEDRNHYASKGQEVRELVTRDDMDAHVGEIIRQYRAVVEAARAVVSRPVTPATGGRTVLEAEIIALETALRDAGE